MNCKICNEPTKPILDKQNTWGFFHCKKCEFIFKNPKNYLSVENEQKHYAHHNNTIESVGYVKMFKKFINLTFEPYMDEIQTALEFGSGPGPVLAELLKQKNIEVDIYDKYFAPKKVYEDKQYDLITSTEVIEHIQNPLKVFNLFSKHIKKGGYLALMTQFHPNNEENFKKWWYKIDPTHICFFRVKTFEVLANMYGFEVLKHDSKKSILFKKL